MDAIYKLLFPLLAKLPGADDTLSLTPPPPSSHPVTTTRDCIPKHPDWEGGKLRGLEVCDQLPSSQLYQEYVCMKVCISQTLTDTLTRARARTKCTHIRSVILLWEREHLASYWKTVQISFDENIAGRRKNKLISLQGCQVCLCLVRDQESAHCQQLQVEWQKCTVTVFPFLFSICAKFLMWRVLYNFVVRLHYFGIICKVCLSPVYVFNVGMVTLCKHKMAKEKLSFPCPVVKRSMKWQKQSLLIQQVYLWQITYTI